MAASRTSHTSNGANVLFTHGTVFHAELGFIPMAAICNDELDGMISASVSGLSLPSNVSNAASENRSWENQLPTGSCHISYSVSSPYQAGDPQISRDPLLQAACHVNDIFPITDEMAMDMLPEDWELQGIFEYVNDPSV
jgi:hypothetical protein